MTQNKPSTNQAGAPALPSSRSTPPVLNGETQSTLRRLFTGQRLSALGLLPVIVVVAILGAITSSSFLTWSNIVNNIVAYSAPLAILVIAEGIILIGGYFDLSLQSTVGFSVVLMAVLMGSSGAGGLGWPSAIAVLAMVAAAVVIGLVNGFMVSTLKLNAFIVTLAMLILLQGLTLGISKGKTYTDLPDFITYLGSGRILGLPVQAVIFVLAFALAAVFMRLVPTGRSLYAMGGSAEAARAAGINTRRLTIGLFVFGSLMAVFAGLLLVSQTSAAAPSLGNGIIFNVFAAAVLGGIDLNGGRGSLVGAALGVLLLGMIQNILTLSNVPSFWIDAANGAIILGALLVGRVSSLASKMRRS